VYELQRADSVAHEAAVLVGVLLSNPSANGSLAKANGGPAVHEDPLDELAGLATSAGARVVGRITQRREVPDKTTYLGRGKVEELRQLVDREEADVVIFDNDLSAAQTRNLEKALSVKVLDRTELILDIFATGAKTHEARLAVELAQLQYSLPRLKRMWTHLSRIKMGIGMRGPGEKQLEVDRRLVEKRIHDLASELRQIERRKERLVASRHDHMTVSLVGYTNAGKSTLMNALTGAGVAARDKLFSTLDTRTRRWQLPGWGPVLLSDTVGFIRHLPHGLVASFKATLEEARQADLLLHVADASNPAATEQIRAVYEVLEELGIQQKDTLLVLNKIDNFKKRPGHPAPPANGQKVGQAPACPLDAPGAAGTPSGRSPTYESADALPSRVHVEHLLSLYPNAVAISAKSGEGLDELSRVVGRLLSQSFLELDVETGVENGRLLAFMAAHGEVLGREYTDGRVKVHCRLPKQYAVQINGEGTVVRTHGDGNIVRAAQRSV
jgi:GTP-binding protein HflX